MHVLVLNCNIALDIDVGHDNALFLASKKRCGAHYVIMEQLHPLPYQLLLTVIVKHLAVTHYIILLNLFTYCEVHT
jgi:hypothetical protein